MRLRVSCNLVVIITILIHMQTSEDRVERALLSLAADRRATQPDDDDQASQSAEWDTLAAPEWPGVPAKSMLLSPSRCRALWKQFASDTNFIVQQVTLQRSLPKRIYYTTCHLLLLASSFAHVFAVPVHTCSPTAL